MKLNKFFLLLCVFISCYNCTNNSNKTPPKVPNYLTNHAFELQSDGDYLTSNTSIFINKLTKKFTIANFSKNQGYFWGQTLIQPNNGSIYYIFSSAYEITKCYSTNFDKFIPDLIEEAKYKKTQKIFNNLPWFPECDLFQVNIADGLAHWSFCNNFENNVNNMFQPVSYSFGSIIPGVLSTDFITYYYDDSTVPDESYFQVPDSNCIHIPSFSSFLHLINEFKKSLLFLSNLS
eukprot:TRINITY_DN5430_c0_g1_i1.p1 TRINITY_DN5430_c0_g1~~TRINITY_DN5430_c0_g1_i1.p1  ORF type:complete len:233 (-),score=29.34 TRINITY_DN5430_c0_g1_i1:190-888(-)